MKPENLSLHLNEPIAAEGATGQTPAATDWLGRLRSRWLPREGGQELEVRLFGRALRARLSPAAVAAATRLEAPLTVEMELYFSCLVRKAVYFRNSADDSTLPAAARTPLVDNLTLQFRPVTTAHCRVDEVGDKPPVETMPVVKPQAFVPRWVNIDYHRGRWVGEYGY